MTDNNTNTSASLKQWAKTLLADAILIATAYFWIIEQIDGAANIFLFIACFFSLFKLLIGLTQDRTWFEKNPAAPGIRTHSAIARLFIIGVLAWTGSFWILAFNVTSILFFEAARNKEPKSAAAFPEGSGE